MAAMLPLYAFPEFNLVVYGRPIGKARPRVLRNGNVYTPPATQQWEDYISLLARQKTMNEIPFPDEAVSVLLTFYCTKGAADIDNLAKAVLDALNGIVWTDDKQVTVLHVFKDTAKPHRVEITVTRRY